MSTILKELGYTEFTEEEKENFLKLNPHIKEIATEFNVPLKQLVIFVNKETHHIRIGRDRKKSKKT